MKVMSVYTPFFTNHLKYDKDKKQTYGINPNDKKEVDKNKSFYKNIRFKQFIKKANYFLESESKNEERYLQEILEKELQGKEI